jgi:hypothetical protein
MNRGLLINDHGIINEVRANVLKDQVWVEEKHVVLVLIRGKSELLASLLGGWELVRKLALVV